MPLSSGSGDSFEIMKSRMTESVNSRIEVLENSKGELDNGFLESAEQLIAGLESVKEEVSGAEDEAELFEVKQRLDSLLNTATEKLKNLPGFLTPDMSSGPEMQNRSGNFSRTFESRSERRPEMPEILNNTGKASGENMTMENREPPGQPPENPGETGNITKEDSRETANESGFLGKLINALISLFS
ncbi:hypothetical protein [Methanosarcina sp.]|uniref:hypothetical protein n=1 Tax=Methanosarcina sp. TaxID=2213 RepID=UPI003C753E66